jgi:hypothetical protein
MCKKIKLARNTTTYANNRGSMASGSKCTTSVRSHPVIRRNRNICIAARIIKSMARATALAPKLALFILTGTDIYRERYLCKSGVGITDHPGWQPKPKTVTYIS